LAHPVYAPREPLLHMQLLSLLRGSTQLLMCLIQCSCCMCSQKAAAPLELLSVLRKAALSAPRELLLNVQLLPVLWESSCSVSSNGAAVCDPRSCCSSGAAV